MAELVVNTDKILRNIRKLDSFLTEHDKQWSLIAKVLCGNKDALDIILNDPKIKSLHSIGDSRISNLAAVKEVRPDITTMYIKPPAVPLVPEVIEVADISVATSKETLDALEAECRKQNKIHRVVIMIELGELREGVLRENLVDFYEHIFNLEYVEVIGIGTNLGCMYGIEPTYDKMIQLSLYKELLEAKFHKNMELISGGSSITLPLVESGRLPKNINHFRIGEAVFFGTSPLDEKQFMDLETDIFVYNGNVIELEEKERVPDGVLTGGHVGHTGGSDSSDTEEKLKKLILDFGILDVDIDDLKPKDKRLNFVGTTSDMTVYELLKKKKEKEVYTVGSKVEFEASYMGIAKLMNSNYIEKKIIHNDMAFKREEKLVVS